jgi:hypothetical protein
VPDVVFPTGVDQRTDLGQPDRIDVYFGMAGDRIGVRGLSVPEELPEEMIAGPAWAGPLAVFKIDC